MSKRLRKPLWTNAFPTGSVDTDDIASMLNNSRGQMVALQTDKDLDSPIAPERLMSEDWTYDEGEQSQGDSTVYE